MVLDRHKRSSKKSITMDEPLKKKSRLGNNNYMADAEFELLQEHLVKNCLCTLPNEILRRLISWFRSTDVLRNEMMTNWSRDKILVLITSVQLMCDMTMRQYTQGFICPRLSEIRYLLMQPENMLANFLMEVANLEDPFILFAASKTLTSLLLIMDLHIDPKWLDKLAENIEECPQSTKISFSLDVLKGIIEWKEFDEHTLEDNTPDDKLQPITCHVQSVETEQFDCTDLKCLCIKSLGQKWPVIMTRFDSLIKHNHTQFQSSIITFLNLWESVVSVKANLSVTEIEPYYMNLNCYVALLSNNTPAVIWKHLISLFNEVMCYGSTLSLQKNLEDHDYPCRLAHMVVRSVKDRQLLNMVPYKGGNDLFGGNRSGDGDKVLLKKVILMILKAVAITVEETKYDSSSDSSVASEVEDADADMALIERSIHDVMKKLDGFMKTHVDFHPEVKLAQWVVQLFTDQDDYLVESMLCCLDVATGLCYRNNSIPDLRRNLNPSVTFLQFLETVVFDAGLLLDYLISNETCFLLYFYRILKYIRKNSQELIYACGSSQLRKVQDLLSGLRTSIERLVCNKLFPYNIAPVIKQLKMCEELIQRYIC